jgi:hypothetical protein
VAVELALPFTCPARRSNQDIELMTTVEGQMAGKSYAMHQERGPLMDQSSEGTIETTKRKSD